MWDFVIIWSPSSLSVSYFDPLSETPCTKKLNLVGSISAKLKLAHFVLSWHKYGQFGWFFFSDWLIQIKIYFKTVSTNETIFDRKHLCKVLKQTYSFKYRMGQSLWLQWTLLCMICWLIRISSVLVKWNNIGKKSFMHGPWSKTQSWAIKFFIQQVGFCTITFVLVIWSF